MLGIIFSNIYDAKLKTLTERRTVASLPFGGRYRLIDFVLSNMINSDVRNIGIITKYNYQSLMEHLGDLGDWDLDVKGSQVRILPPFSYGMGDIYRGKIEALRGAMSFLEKRNEEYVVMSDCINVCSIDLKDVLKSHIKSGADVTVAANRENDDKVYDLIIEPEPLSLRINSKCRENDLCSMGIFIVNRKKLLDLTEKSSKQGYYHFERDILQKGVLSDKLSINIYKFDGCVLRCDSEKDYFKNNLLVNDEKVRNKIFGERPVYTKSSDNMPVHFGKNSKLITSTVADGCDIHGCVENSVIFGGVKIADGCKIKNSVIMDNVCINEGAVITNAIINKSVTIERNTALCGTKSHPAIIF